MEIYLVRHTLPDIAAGVCYGHSDINVATSFPDDLISVKNKLADIEAAAFYSSPSLRCTRLAESLHGGTIIRDARIQELNFGDWELCSWNSIPHDAMELWANDHVNLAPPNGETFQQLHQRAAEFLREITVNPDNTSVIVVAHAGAIRALLAEILGLSLMNIFRIQIGYGSVTQLLVDQQGIRIGYVNL